MKLNLNPNEVTESVARALVEDVGSGDITATLISSDTKAEAQLITRQQAVICGIPWVDEVYRQLSGKIRLQWQVQEGDLIHPGQLLCKLRGPAQMLLTGERCALNFLQTLSATATTTRWFAQQLSGTTTQLLDTRKTIPGLRAAQKYAVRCGDGHNHRMGLFDAFLIKENHIAACGSIAAAVEKARQLHPDKPVEVEVESVTELQQALAAKVDRVMLDNFDLNAMKEAVAIAKGKVKLEVSGDVNLDNIKAIATTGVDYISVGALTKNINAIDLTIRLARNWLPHAKIL